MKLSFRWFGDTDPVDLWSIKQIPGMENIVTQIQPSEIGGLLDEREVLRYKELIQSRGLSFDVFESLVVHPSIKLGLSERDYYIDIFKKNRLLILKMYTTFFKGKGRIYENESFSSTCSFFIIISQL